MEDINKLEFSVLERLSNKYPTLKKHLAYLKVRSREITGVGMYVNFCYSKNDEILENLNMPDTSISTNENIEIRGLKYGLAYEVDISNGKINFIEFATCGGEEWNGVANDFTFVKI